MASNSNIGVETVPQQQDTGSLDEPADPSTGNGNTPDIRSSTLSFRPPSTSPAYESANNRPFTAPPTDFLSGPWHVTHSTLPMWKSNRNVVITYTPLPSSTTNESSPLIDDLVAYNSNSNPTKQKTVRGIDTPDPNIPAAYNWRGKGWLRIASSHWEVLGWGHEDGGWVVTYFAKTLFTPAGIDLYARRRGGLSAGLLEQVRENMRNVEDDAFRKQAEQIFEIVHDWEKDES